MIEYLLFFSLRSAVWIGLFTVFVGPWHTSKEQVYWFVHFYYEMIAGVAVTQLLTGAGSFASSRPDAQRPRISALKFGFAAEAFVAFWLYTRLPINPKLLLAAGTSSMAISMAAFSFARGLTNRSSTSQTMAPRLLLVFFTLAMMKTMLVSLGFHSPNAFHLESHSFLTTVGFLLMAICLISVFAHRFWIFACLGLGVLLSLLLQIDLLYFRFYKEFPNILELTSLGMVNSVVIDGAIALWKFSDLLLWIDLPFWLYGALRSDQSRPAGTSDVKRPHFALACLAASAITILPGAIFYLKSRESGHASMRAFGTSLAAERFGMFGYHFIDFEMSRQSNAVLTVDERQYVASFFSERRIHSSSYAGAGKGMNVVMILAESIQDFVVGAEWGGQKITPHLDLLRDSSIISGGIHDIVGAGRTTNAEYAAFNSVLPLRRASVAWDFGKNDFYALPEILRRNGYATFSVAATRGDFMNVRRIHARYGFDKSLFETDAKDRYPRIIPWAMSDMNLFEQGAMLVRDSERPFFLFLEPSSCHYPFGVPKEMRELNLGSLEGQALGDYFHSVHYFDKSLGHFLDLLDQNGQRENTVFIIFGDHDAKIEGDSSLSEFTGVNDSDTMRLQKRDLVTIIVYVPGYEPSTATIGFDRNIGSMIDIAPTVLSLLGLDQEGGLMIGQPLASRDTNLVVYPDGSATDGVHFFSTGISASLAHGCYNVESERLIPRSACEKIAAVASDRIRISELLVYGNLIGTLKTLGTAVKDE